MFDSQLKMLYRGTQESAKTVAKSFDSISEMIATVDHRTPISKYQYSHTQGTHHCDVFRWTLLLRSEDLFGVKSSDRYVAARNSKSK